jgi:hypothetical protein
MLAVFRSLFLELHDTVLLGKKRVVSADTDIESGVILCTALANDDITRDYLLAAVNFHAESFTFRIATVLSAAACFLMSHCNIPYVYQSPMLSHLALLNSV